MRATGSASSSAEATSDATPASGAGSGTTGVADGIDIRTLILDESEMPVGTVRKATISYQNVKDEPTLKDQDAFSLNFNVDGPPLTPDCADSIAAVDDFERPVKELAMVQCDGDFPTVTGGKGEVAAFAVRGNDGESITPLYNDIVTQCSGLDQVPIQSEFTKFYDGDGVHVFMGVGDQHIHLYGGGVEDGDLHVILVAQGLSESDAAKLYEKQKEHFRTQVEGHS